jgi:uncharacterized protein DUF4279
MRDAKNAPRISTHFYISGWDLDPDACTVEVGLEPSDVWRQKHDELRARADIPSVSWNIRRVRTDSYSVGESVDEILDLVWSSRERVKTFVNGKNVLVGVACSVTIQSDRPVYELSANTIRRLAELGCEFTLDIIDYSQ